MDRAGSATWAERAGATRGPGEGPLLPSRGVALATLRAALLVQDGPVLLTGESGVGKTWLCRRLRAGMPSPWRWVSVDLTPAIGAAELYRLILHGSGLPPGADPAEARTALGDLLADHSADGERWGLIVEEGHNASPGVLEELRVLGNRMGEPGSFAALVLVGQNRLARRMATRPLASFDARLVASVHLRPILVDELGEFLSRLRPDRAWTVDEVEHLHRDVGGNPRRALLRLGVRNEQHAALSEPPAHPTPTPQAARRAIAPAEVRSPVWEAPPVVPVKPPLHVGDGMIEVGWEPTPDLVSDPEPENDQEDRPASDGIGGMLATTDGPSLATEEIIDDHYAALQAWSEWAKNQGREPVSPVHPPGPDGPDDGPEPDDEERPRQAPLSPAHPSVWAEGEHAFAPYSQLFSRLRQSRDSL